MFAIGVILFSMIMGRPPFWKADPIADRHFKVLHLQQYSYFWSMWEDQYIKPNGLQISDEIRMIFNSLISSIPSFRLSLNELRSHPWIIKYRVNEQLVREEMQ